MSERQPGGFEQEPIEPSVHAEVQPTRELTRQELLRSLSSLDLGLGALPLDSTEKIRYHIETKSMPPITSGRDALFYTLESIDQRMLSLLHPYLCEKSKQEPLSVLEEQFSHYIRLTNHARLKPPVDEGVQREHRHSLLADDVSQHVARIEQGLDLCEYQQFGRSKLAFLTIYPLYKNTLGSLSAPIEDIRPWRNGVILDGLIESSDVGAVVGLSVDTESGITPLSEYQEND